MPESLSPEPDQPDAEPSAARSEPEKYLNYVDKKNTLNNRKMAFHSKRMQDESLSAAERDWHAREFKSWQYSALHHDTGHHDELVDQAIHYAGDKTTYGQTLGPVETSESNHAAPNENESESGQQAA